MARTRRTETIRVLIRAGAPLFGAEYSSLSHELNAIESSESLKGARRFLVRVLHTTRLLDSTLKAYTVHYGITLGTRPPSLGSYLWALTQHRVPG